MDQDKKPVFKPIEIGTTIGERTQVKSGLAKNEQVLISFPPGMQPKAEVRGPLGNLTGGNKRNSSSSSGNNAPPPQ
jgi:HlyD family secretion protein